MEVVLGDKNAIIKSGYLSVLNCSNGSEYGNSNGVVESGITDIT